MRQELTEHIEKNWTRIVYSGVLTYAILKWLDECLQGNHSVWGMVGYAKMELFFEYPSDAMLFKLAYQ